MMITLAPLKSALLFKVSIGVFFALYLNFGGGGAVYAQKKKIVLEDGLVAKVGDRLLGHASAVQFLETIESFKCTYPSGYLFEQQRFWKPSEKREFILFPKDKDYGKSSFLSKIVGYLKLIEYVKAQQVSLSDKLKPLLIQSAQSNGCSMNFLFDKDKKFTSDFFDLIKAEVYLNNYTSKVISLGETSPQKTYRSLKSLKNSIDSKVDYTPFW